MSYWQIFILDGGEFLNFKRIYKSDYKNDPVFFWYFW